MTKRQEIESIFQGEELLFADGFDDAIIGVEPDSVRVIYDRNRMVEILMEDGMEEEEAIEFLEYNTWGAYVGEHTPIYIVKV